MSSNITPGSGKMDITGGLASIEKKVIQSLRNPEWDYRTISGIAKETGLDEKMVGDILKSRKDLIRESIVRSASGERLFTLSKNVNHLRDFWAAFRMINEEKF